MEPHTICEVQCVGCCCCCCHPAAVQPKPLRLLPQEVALIGMTAYLSYLAGDVFGFSGILSLFVCAVAISHYALNIISGGCLRLAVVGASQAARCCAACHPPSCPRTRSPACSRVAHHHHLRLPHPQLRVGGRHLCVLRPGCPGPAQVAGGRLGRLWAPPHTRALLQHGCVLLLQLWPDCQVVLSLPRVRCRTPSLARWPGCSGSCSSCCWCPAPSLW